MKGRPELIVRYLKGIQVGVSRLMQLVRDLIRHRSGRWQSTTTHSAARPTNRRCWQSGASGGSGIPSTGSYTQYPEFIYAIDDRASRLGQSATLTDIFSRLVDNAIKFTPRDSQRIDNAWATSTDTTVRVAVPDHGIGLVLRYLNCSIFYQHDRPQLEQQGSGSWSDYCSPDLIALHG